MTRTVSRKAILSAMTVLSVISCIAAGTAARAEEGGKAELRYALEDGKVYKYKADFRSQMFFGAYSFETITGQEVEVSKVETLDNENTRVAVTFNKSSTKMMRMGNLIEREPSIKPEGRTVKVEIDRKGKVVEALGFIMGVKKGRALDSYMEKWFFELPEEPVEKGSVWTVPVDKTFEEGEGQSYAVKGAAQYELKKFDKKNGIEVAEIEGGGEFEIHSESPQGIFEGKAKVKHKVYIALEGGYIVEGESSTETKGKMVGVDQSGKESESEMTRVESDKIKLEN